MKILFDQGTPVPLRKHLDGHVILTANEQGWATLSNGDLLDAAEREGFQVLITTDQSLSYQQNLTTRIIAIIVLRTTSWPIIQSQLDKVRQAVQLATNGTYQELDF